MEIALAVTTALAALAAVALWLANKKSDARAADLEASLAATRERFKSVVDADAEAERVRREAAEQRERIAGDALRAADEAESRERRAVEARSRAEEDLEALAAESQRLRDEVALLSEQAHLHDFGVYEPRYQFPESADYKAKLDEVRKAQKTAIKNGAASHAPKDWTVNGDKRKGAKMVRDRLRLMFRAFNGECDAAVARVRYNNVEVMERRMENAFERVNKLSVTTGCAIEPMYLRLKLAELHLTHEFHEKRQAEREEQRQIREQMREEMKAKKEVERAQREAEKDEARYEKALAKARAEVADAAGAKQEKLRSEIEELERRLAEAHANKERAVSRAQMTRAGHVYVISNVGSFGDDVYKIGMTRRLDPMDRVRELGDASVPFRFDVHAVIYSDDAPGLEAELHRQFDGHRVNRVNTRKEFFRVPLGEVARVVRENHGEIEFTLAAEAEEYRKTVALLRSPRAVAVGA